MHVAILIAFGVVILLNVLAWIVTSWSDLETVKQHELTAVNLLLVAVISLCFTGMLGPVVGLFLLVLCLSLDALVGCLILIDSINAVNATAQAQTQTGVVKTSTGSLTDIRKDHEQQ
jgi:hypothetical protein